MEADSRHLRAYVVGVIAPGSARAGAGTACPGDGSERRQLSSLVCADSRATTTAQRCVRDYGIGIQMNNLVKALIALDARVEELGISHDTLTCPSSAFSADSESAAVLLAETYLRAHQAVTDLIIAAAQDQIFEDFEIDEDDINVDWCEGWGDNHGDNHGDDEVARAVSKGRARVMVALAHFTIDRAFVALANETSSATPRR